ncbi:082cbfee-7600-40f9-9312-cd2f0157f420 [Sclerotinia trifoliorum]|uniref:082cbfee-7600-40f9-9312-cd2f0157f420 n=1 Tax=Sclerotinia trifoliorum TaxID=28548 RepID=A0A8H2VWE6_9HELO|nr:082cbfee-7600-40f9-9312-cd2f0157f420 [Sclerotinia trifoliorum]
MVYHIAAGGRKVALKIHKYENSDISLSGTPKLNIFFERERNAYNRLSQTSELPPASTPKYYGYINFTKPPQVNRTVRIPRKLFRSTVYRPAVYTDFLVDEVPDEMVLKDPWRSYFMNESGNCILQGVILDEIVAARHIDIYGSDSSNFNIARSGREGLKALHLRGILHGDVKNRLNAMIKRSGDRVIWIDFSMGEECDANAKDKGFRRKARREMREWDRFFEVRKVGK